MNTREALTRLEQTADNIRASIGDPQDGVIIKARNRAALDAMLQRFSAQEIAEAVAAHMVQRFGPNMSTHYLGKAMGRK